MYSREMLEHEIAESAARLGIETPRLDSFDTKSPYCLLVSWHIRNGIRRGYWFKASKAALDDLGLAGVLDRHLQTGYRGLLKERNKPEWSGLLDVASDKA
jgi:hypothetical protein